jgi:hypothetical protein
MAQLGELAGNISLFIPKFAPISVVPFRIPVLLYFLLLKNNFFKIIRCSGVAEKSPHPLPPLS